MTARGGFGLTELLVGMGLALAVVAGTGAALRGGARMLAALRSRAEIEDTVQAAIELLAFDVRRTGFDPRATGLAGLAAAAPGRLALAADLDGDGAVDANSEENIAWVCNAAAVRLSRVVGAQSMPVADGASACAFSYLDETGTPLPLPAAGLAAPALAQVRAVVIDLELSPARPGAPVARRARIALRSTP